MEVETFSDRTDDCHVTFWLKLREVRKNIEIKHFWGIFITINSRQKKTLIILMWKGIRMIF